ncbi:MAG: hypothetical protein PHX61_05610 [Alphaproteobacteria bacterium]|nr:hypothetical protein [Alphaproteobacteria bacterium]
MPTPLSVTYDLNSLRAEFTEAAQKSSQEHTKALMKSQPTSVSFHMAIMNQHAEVVRILDDAAANGKTKVVSRTPLSDMAGSICGRIEDLFSYQYKAGKISFE